MGSDGPGGMRWARWRWLVGCAVAPNRVGVSRLSETLEVVHHGVMALFGCKDRMAGVIWGYQTPLWWCLRPTGEGWVMPCCLT